MARATDALEAERAAARARAQREAETERRCQATERALDGAQRKEQALREQLRTKEWDLAEAERERARWHLERTAAPDDRRLEDLHVAAAITSNQTADLAEGMIGFSVDDGGDWEAPPEDDDVWTPVERGSE